MGIIIALIIGIIVGGAGMLIYLSTFTQSEITFETK